MTRHNTLGKVCAGAIASMLASGALAQEMTLTLVSPDGLQVPPGGTIQIDVIAEWTPPAIGLAGVFFDVVNDGNLELGEIDISESTQRLGRNALLRFSGDGGGEIIDVTGDGAADIAGIQTFQQAPAVNAGFSGANPIRLFSFEWTAPTDSPTGFTASVALQVEAPFPAVYVDQFLSEPYSAVTSTLSWEVLPPPDPRDLNDDGAINQIDLGLLLAGFNTTSGVLRFNPRADLDGNGVIDFSDLSFLVALLNGNCPLDGADLPNATMMSLRTVDNTSVGLGDDPTEPMFNGGVTHHTFDLVVETPNGVDWTSASVEAELSAPDVVFFDHPAESGGGFGPLAVPIALNPALAFDTFWSGATKMDTDPTARFPGFAGALESTDVRRCATWYDLDDRGPGAASIARYTIVAPAGVEGAVGTVRGISTTRDFVSVPVAFEFSLTIPPSCLADWNGSGDVTVADLLSYLDLWFLNDLTADVSNDGQVSVVDLLTFLDAWLSGCP